MDGWWVCGKVDGKITDIVIKLLRRIVDTVGKVAQF